MKRSEIIRKKAKSGIAVIAALALLILAVPAWADEPANPEAQRTSGGTTTDYDTLAEAINDAQSGDTVKLLRDVNTSASISITAKTITLDLNGFGIVANATVENRFSVITISPGGHLTITDSRKDEQHYYTVDNSDTNGAGLATVCDTDTYDRYNGTKGTFKGGYITGGTGTKKQMPSTEYWGGGIYLEGRGSMPSENKSYLTMTGGTIIGNQAKEGGGIYGDAYAVLNLTNCNIIGNQAENGGGGILCANYTQLTMTGCEVRGNRATNSGGGIGLEKGNNELKLTNCKIRNNTANGRGGGIGHWANGKDIISDTSVFGNKAGAWGGGICFENDKTEHILTNVEIYDNEITGSDEDDVGAGIYLGHGTLRLNGGWIHGNKVTRDSNCFGGGVSMNANDDAAFIVSGKVVITENTSGNKASNVYFRKDEQFTPKISIDGSLDESSRIGVATENNETRTVTSGLPGRGRLSNFFSDNEDYIIIADDHNEAALSLPESVITKVPEAITGLVYNGQAQALIRPGEVTGGTFYYAVTGEGDPEPASETYSPSIPTGINAGTYSVWYKAVGDQYHSDTKPVRISVTVAARTKYAILSARGLEHILDENTDAVIMVANPEDDSKTYDKFTGVTVGGKPVPEGGCTTARGSLILTLKAGYLNTLSVGEYPVTISFTDGTAEMMLKILQKKVPKTGDSGSPALWIGLILLGLAGIGILAVSRKRK
ncbi:MAG: LPXTG cell wall anchor domain-containing protein [Clostridia bacterium]|nr:LPXTG cell wall anchor domain-containing protein [Clostridia bacterium]